MSHAPRVVCVLVGLVLIGAVTMKVVAPGTFLAAVQHAVEPVVRLAFPVNALLATGILVLEAILGSLLVFRPTRSVVHFTAALLTAFATVLILRFSQPGAPPCGCLGVALAETASSQAWWEAARNIALVGALLLIGFPGPVTQHGTGTRPVRLRGARAFTIVELLVTIVLIGVLLALMFPALVAVRRQALIIRSHAHLRQVFVATHAYTEANRDTFPRFEALGGSFDLVRHRGLLIPYTYFAAHQSLWMALVAPDDAAFHAMAAAGTYADRNAPEYDGYEDLRFSVYYSSKYWMSPTLVADPSVFDEPISTWRRIESPALLRGIRTFEITHPSRKGLFVDLPLMFSLREPSESAQPPPIFAVFADGSAATLHYNEDFESKNVVHVQGGRFLAMPVFSTRHGVRGVDR